MTEPATILVVDDDEFARDVLARSIELAGYKVIQAEDGQHAMQQMTQHLPDLIVLDINMPSMNGFEVLAKLKTNPDTTDIPVIIFTALSRLVHPDVHINGVSKFLLKGSTRLSKVMETIKDLLEEDNKRKQVTATNDEKSPSQ